jgi:acyl-CoA dehydrogenase
MAGPPLTAAECRVREAVRDFTRRKVSPVAAAFDSSGDAPEEIYRAFFETGLLHGYIPCGYGGQGHTATTTTLVAEELAFGCLAVASALVVAILPISIVLAGGSEQQKEALLRPLSKRFSLPAIACTESRAGNDLRAIATRALHSGSQHCITGEKAYVSNLPFADFVVVIARTELGGKTGSGRALSAFAVPRDSVGFVPGPRWQTLGLRSLAVCSLSLNEVAVSEECRIGPEGAGLTLLNDALDLSRVMMASYAVGASRRVVSELLQLGRTRKKNGTKLSREQSYRFALVDMEADISAARALAWIAATRHDAGLPYTREASIAKLQGGRLSRRVAERATWLLDWEGMSSCASIEKFRREVPALCIIEGAEPIQSEIVYAEILRNGL